MAPISGIALLRSILAVVALASLAGCAARYDNSGSRIYSAWPFGDPNSYDPSVDYSNPRLPILPRSRPPDQLWPSPSPYGYRDLMEYASVAPAAANTANAGRVGDNALCATTCDLIAPGVFVVARADFRARDDRNLR